MSWHRIQTLERNAMVRRTDLSRPTYLPAILMVAVVVVAGAVLYRSRVTARPWDIASFDGKRAFDDLQRLVKFGPRSPGSEALEQTRQYIGRELTADGIDVYEDPFVASTPAGNIPMKNLMGIVPGQSSEVIAIAGHYDTARLDGVQFVGANDGGSSTAFLLEMARVLIKRKNPLTYWLMFFDGEEALQQWSARDSLYGSRHMADQLDADGRLKRVRAFILVDMVGDKHLDILRESHSTLWLSDLVFRSAHELGCDAAFSGGTYPVEDDHLPFLEKGVPAVDIIDVTPFKSYHHTAADTVDQCSAGSLEVIGRVVLATVAAIERSKR